MQKKKKKGTSAAQYAQSVTAAILHIEVEFEKYIQTQTGRKKLEC